MHRYLARHGYACLRLDIRGTGDSEGLILDEYTVQEQEDGVAAIAWAAAQDWCDGQVAMYGISWGGFNALQIAARQPPALKTIITVGSTDDRYYPGVVTFATAGRAARYGISSSVSSFFGGIRSCLSRPIASAEALAT